ncbi:MAG: hypothetical protein KCHDKBKB_00583 [Elusimicrobia bacterium]|nr:hypothetical protein [Elusimicrobiota bacterium]
MGKLTKQQQNLIVMLVLFIGGGGYVYWNYMLKPALQNIATRKEKYAELVSKIETAERQARRLPALQNELAKLEADLINLEKQLPKDKDVPNILRILTREAIQEGLQFMRLAPKPLNKQEFFEIIPFDLQFTGTVHALARFLTSLGQQDRIFQAQNISLTPGGGTQGEQQGVVNLNMNLTIQTYSYAG